MKIQLVLLVIVVSGCKSTHTTCEAYEGRKVVKKK